MYLIWRKHATLHFLRDPNFKIMLITGERENGGYTILSFILFLQAHMVMQIFIEVLTITCVQ